MQCRKIEKLLQKVDLALVSTMKSETAGLIGKSRIVGKRGNCGGAQS